MISFFCFSVYLPIENMVCLRDSDDDADVLLSGVRIFQTNACYIQSKFNLDRASEKGQEAMKPALLTNK